MNVRNALSIAAACLAMTACSPPSRAAEGPVKVEVVKGADGYVLMRGGEPYTVRGAGMAIDDIARFAANGGNSIRTWTTDSRRQDTGKLLDAAQAHGVTVALGLPMQAERHGFDYDDPAAGAAQRESFRDDILRYRDHPALLAWIVGNELNHSYTNPRVWDAVEDVARMIHDLDPNHPVTTAMEAFRPGQVAEALARAPSLDFLSFQLYGGLFSLPEHIRSMGFTGPFMVTEWGTIGYWEMEKTAWGAPVELTSSEKADVIQRAWREVLTDFPGQLIGSYVFFWGQKQERTPTWFGLVLESGELTEAADVMHVAWTGTPPANRTPRVKAMLLDGRTSRESVTLVAGRPYEASFEVADPDGDPLRFRWEVKPESGATQAGGDFEAGISGIEGLLQDPAAATTSITVHEPGRYRLFAYAFDGEGHAAHANIPFLVEPGPSTAEGFVVRPLPAEWSSGKAKAVSYSGFREGQHPDRGAGAVNPGEAEVLEDLQILVRDGFRLIRMYDSRENTRTTLPGRPLMVLEAGWPTTSSEFPDQASEANQRRHYRELMEWSAGKGTTVFFFEAFDEPWKGNPNDPLAAEKHFGLYRVDRTHKEVMRK
jgi:exo-beta-1,3-glucanase (GH17 family)